MKKCIIVPPYGNLFKESKLAMEEICRRMNFKMKNLNFHHNFALCFSGFYLPVGFRKVAKFVSSGNM